MGLIPIEDLDLTFAMFVTCWILIFIFHKTNGAGITAAAYCEKHQGPVVQKLITANPALDVVQGFSFSCFNPLSTISPNENEISLYMFTTCLNIKVARIKEVTTKDRMS